MRPTSSKIIPPEIINFILFAFNEDNNSKMSSGKWSYIIPFTKSINKFLKDKKSEYPNYYSIFSGKVSNDRINRALNRKTPNGASKELRNLLCFYATDGQKSWNQTIGDLFPNFSYLQDEITKTNSEVTSKKSMNDLYEIVAELTKKFDKPELHIIEEQIKTIPKPELDDPSKPEFPPAPFFKPKFPASEIFKINVPGFKNVWLKDESTNPTGTHKDRMGWEIKIKAEEFKLKEISIISSGSAAIAIQHMFNLYKVPTKLNVLVDIKLNDEIKNAIRAAGSELYETDLRSKELRNKHIRKLTENKKGIDITYRETMDIQNITYYDWMSYEILNFKPDVCFIPFGTGDLYINILNIVHKEYNARNYRHDRRFKGKISNTIKCHFLGATTINEDSKMEKLFSYFLPSIDKHNQIISELKNNRCIGNLSDIYSVEEKYVDEALAIASEEKINCEPSGIAGLALLLQVRNLISPDSRILIVNTGKTNYYPDN